MHKIFIVMMGALFMLASCTKDDNGQSNGLEQFSIKINTAADVKTRSTSATMRYILEIWHNETLNGVTKSTLFQRMVQSGDKANEFDFRLITNQNYDLLVWVDNTNDATGKTDYHYLTNATVNNEYVGLKGIEMITSTSTYTNKDHTRDAFFGNKNVDVDMDHVKGIEITCTRPFAQLNIISTDWKEVNEQYIAALKPNKVVFEFTGYTKFNVLSDVVAGEKTMYAEIPRDITTDPTATEAHITCDYLFAPTTDVLTNGTACPVLKFYNGVNFITDSQDMLSNVRLQRNYITNARGGLISKKGKIEVEVNQLWDGLIVDFFNDDDNDPNGV